MQILSVYLNLVKHASASYYSKHTDLSHATLCLCVFPFDGDKWLVITVFYSRMPRRCYIPHSQCSTTGWSPYWKRPEQSLMCLNSFGVTVGHSMSICSSHSCTLVELWAHDIKSPLTKANVFMDSLLNIEKHILQCAKYSSNIHRCTVLLKHPHWCILYCYQLSFSDVGCIEISPLAYTRQLLMLCRSRNVLRHVLMECIVTMRCIHAKM